MADSIMAAPQPENPDALTDPPDTPALYGEAESGPLLTDPDESKVARAVLKEFTDQDGLKASYLADVRVNEMRRKGHVNVEATKQTDRDEWIVTVVGPPAPGLNKAATLCRKFTSSLFADPPQPDPKPAGADDVHRDQAQFSKRVLDHLLGEGQLDGVTALRRAEDMASTYRRAYLCFYVDPQGERIPMQVEAHPLAQRADQPLAVPGPPDPLTGEATPAEAPSGEAVLRYVTPDGGLSDRLADAAYTWAPKLRRDLFDGRHVRLTPATADDLWDADGVLIASFTPLRDLKRQFPGKFENVDTALLTKHPPKMQMLLPGETKKERQAAGALKGEDALVFTVRKYVQMGGQYPQGAYLVACGDGLLAYRGPWTATMPSGATETLDLPVTEVMQWASECVMDICGAANDLRGQQLAAMLDHTDQVLNAKTFLPLGSMLNPDDVLDTERRILPYNPGGQPVREEVGGLDPAIPEQYESLKQEMQEDVGLSATAQGLEGSNSGDSGRAKFAIIGQAQVALSEPRQNLERAYTRMCRIVLQQVRAFFSAPQKLAFAAEDGSYQEQRWTGADLGDTRDVRLDPGSLSLLSPTQKSEQILALSQAGVQMDPEEIREAVAGNVGAILSLQENPYRKRIQRQLARWEDGPPDGWEPPPPAPPIVASVGPDGQPVMAPPQPVPSPAEAEIWEPVPADELPNVAMIRLTEMAKGMMGLSYTRWPAPWRVGYIAEFQRMRQFAGVATVPEQQQAAAKQAQQQMAAQAALNQQDHQGKLDLANQKAQHEATAQVVHAGAVGA